MPIRRAFRTAPVRLGAALCGPLQARRGRRPVPQWVPDGSGTVAAVGLGQAGGPGRARATVTAGQGRSLMGAPASEHPMPRARGRCQWLNTHRIQVTQGTRESAGCVLSLSFQMSLQRSSSSARRPGGGKATGGSFPPMSSEGPIQYEYLAHADSFELARLANGDIQFEFDVVTSCCH